jgi:hypothetical protein
MSGNWENMEAGLAVPEYAKRVCQEIGWPYSGNLTLICDCILSLARMKGTDVQGGFFLLMAAIEHAKESGAFRRRGRWFFQDGDYARLPAEDEKIPTRKPVARDAQSSPAGQGGLLSALKLTGRPN